MMLEYASLLRTFFSVFFSHYRYFIPFWLAMVATLVLIPLLLSFGRALAGSGNQTEASKHVIASLMGPLLAVYRPNHYSPVLCGGCSCNDLR